MMLPSPSSVASLVLSPAAPAFALHRYPVLQRPRPLARKCRNVEEFTECDNTATSSSAQAVAPDDVGDDSAQSVQATVAFGAGLLVAGFAACRGAARKRGQRAGRIVAYARPRPPSMLPNGGKKLPKMPRVSGKPLSFKFRRDMRFRHWHIGSPGSNKGGDAVFDEKTKEAMQQWGGGAVETKCVNGDRVAMRKEVLPEHLENKRRMKWMPRREVWPGLVRDDEGEIFGVVRTGDEVEVLKEEGGYSIRSKKQEWVRGVVVANDVSNSRAAICPSTGGGIIEVRTNLGLLRRMADARENCTENELRDIFTFRPKGDVEGLKTYCLETLKTIAARSHAAITLLRMGGRVAAHELVEDHGLKLGSIAIRELAHAHAIANDFESAMYLLDSLKKPQAAQLIVECCAVGITEQIEQEKERLGVDFLSLIDENWKVAKALENTRKALPLLIEYAGSCREQSSGVSREGLSEAFNELLQSCGRASSPAVSFRVLEWMERLNVPKDSFTYEAIGMNVVKRVKLLRKVWDLPNAPEEGVPEIVFAGRSNVGKSSLVNMLLGRLALAPTSQRPGRTKTMDFFDVNAGHPALPRFRLIDVPGLGFARVSQELRQRWISLIGGYFMERRSLKVCFHLLDAGLCEILPPDRELWKLLAQSERTDFELNICLTKADHSLPSQMERFAKQVREELREAGSELATNATIFACSSKSKMGKDTLWRKIWTAVGGDVNDGEAIPDIERYRKEEFDPSGRSGEEAEGFSSEGKIPVGRRRRLRRDIASNTTVVAKKETLKDMSA